MTSKGSTAPQPSALRKMPTCTTHSPRGNPDRPAARLMLYYIMSLSLVQTIGGGAGAATIAGQIERLIAAGELRPGERLPAVRTLAADLGVSPATVAAGYRSLRD